MEREQKRGSYIINNQLAFCLYDSFSLSDLLGTLFVIITYTVFFVVLVFSARFFERIIFKITGKTWNRFTNFYTNFIRAIFWNSTIRFMLESYLEVLIANGIVYNSKLTFESVHSSVESGFQIFLMMAYFICPIALTFAIVFDRKSIEREAYWLKYFR